jgi:hypothetical protein
MKAANEIDLRRCTRLVWLGGESLRLQIRVVMMMRVLILLSAVLVLAGVPRVYAQSCTPQSQMEAAERESLRQAALAIAAKVQAGDVAGIRAVAAAAMTPGVAETVGDAAPRLKQSHFTVESLWLFHAEATASTGAPKSAETNAAGLVDFYCALPGEADATFTLQINGPGEYAVALLHATGGSAAWQMSLTLQQVGAEWRLSDLVVKPLTSAGHDGLWYWNAGRDAAKKDQKLMAWLYLVRAENLLTPMNGIRSSNGDKLRAEIAALGMPEVSAARPLVINGGTEKYSITAIGSDDALGGVDVVVHVTAADVSDAVKARARNLAVMRALLAGYPELRGNFHGVWVFADAPGQSAFAIEQTMQQIESGN